VTFAYAQSAATALHLLQRFGAAATLKRQSTGSYDASTGATPVTVSALATTAAVFAYDQKYIDGTLIKQGDQRAYLSNEQVPQQGDVLGWQGADYQVIAVKPLSPAGIVVLYEAQLRG
jgi:hypothetical protein